MAPPYAYDARRRVTSETVAIVGGPVTVLEVGYGTRDNDRPESISATVNGKDSRCPFGFPWRLPPIRRTRHYRK